jgi:predicted DNA-binding protein
MKQRKHFFGISTSAELHDRLAKLAQDMGLSVSALVERIIEENLEKYESTGAKIRKAPDVGAGSERA